MKAEEAFARAAKVNPELQKFELEIARIFRSIEFEADRGGTELVWESNNMSEPHEPWPCPWPTNYALAQLKLLGYAVREHSFKSQEGEYWANSLRISWG